MQIPASLSASPPAERRKHNARHRLRLLSSVHAGEGGSHSVAVLDISATGLLLETAAGLAMGERLRLDLDPAGTCNATIVWSSGRLYGCRFDTPLSKGQLGAALLRGSFVPSVPPAREELARPDEVPAQQRGGGAACPAAQVQGTDPTGTGCPGGCEQDHGLEVGKRCRHAAPDDGGPPGGGTGNQRVRTAAR